MKPRFLLLLFFLVSTISYSQIHFEKGYIITNDGIKTDCFIKNEGWESNPSRIIYKYTLDGPAQKATVEDLKEFGIVGEARFVRAKVQIDTSAQRINKITFYENPEWSTKKLFLKVLIEGKASLYYFKDNIKRFFYSVDDDSIAQLIYKKYKVTGGEIAVNNEFRQQLWLNVKCANAEMSTLEHLDYREKALKKYFVYYNNCNHSEYKTFEPAKVKRNAFNLRVMAGFDKSIFWFKDLQSLWRTKYNFPSQINFTARLDMEYILPFNKNKWSLVFSPDFHSYKIKQDDRLTVDYKAIDFFLGPRYYMFLTDKLRVHLNAFYILPVNVSFDSNVWGGAPDINGRHGLAFGFGIDYGRFSMEYHYYFKRHLMRYITWDDAYHRQAVVLGVDLFNPVKDK